MSSTVVVRIENLFQLKVLVEGKGSSYAFYLLHNDQIIEKTTYAASPSHTFFLRSPGLYRVKSYLRDKNGNISSLISESIRFRGLVPTPKAPEPPSIALVGVSTIAAFAQLLLEKNWDIECFVDPTGKYTGGKFFGKPILKKASPKSMLVGHKNYEDSIQKLIPFDLQVNTDDFIWREVNRFSAMQTYELSRECIKNGLKEGADYLSNSIIRRFNSRVPHQAKIGQGTTLGVGGIGIAIHPRSVIGSNCTIGQNVTIGIRGSGPAPDIGNNVFIGPGAKCLGGRIGNNAVIGANAVVLEEVPDNYVVAGVPARVIHTSSENHKGYTHKRK